MLWLVIMIWYTESEKSMMEFKEVLLNLKPDNYSIELLSEYLGYELGRNPINAESDWMILFSPRIASKDSGVIALRSIDELTPETSTIEIRKLYQQVTELDISFGGSFSVAAAGFVGEQRVVIFPVGSGNRDNRLDLNPITITKNLYLDNLEQLKERNIKLVEDDFWGGYATYISDKVFRKELTTHFLTVVAFYRKKLSELITGSDLKSELRPLLYKQAQQYLDQHDLNDLIQEDSYTSSLAVVVDTIILRQLMRRFLEGYYGPASFEVNNIALGIGSGTMDEAIKQTVDINSHLGDELAIKKLNRKVEPVGQMDLFTDLFSDEELKQTSYVKIEETKKEKIARLTKAATEQFRLAYRGDLFAGSVAEVTNKIDARMAQEFPEFTAKLWADTSSGNYSFRYQDMPPEALEKQYEESMSKDIQIKLDNESQEPIVFYGDDKKEQKDKGAYYTDQRFVEYMVKQTVNVEFEKRRDAISEAIVTGDEVQIVNAIEHLLDLKVADFTAGGGSFLRGAFRNLAGKYQLLTTMNIPQSVLKNYPMLQSSPSGQYLWEKYVLEHMIYGVDVDYKAIIIASLTLTLSSLENHPKDTKLPDLIGRTLIHQNTLINAVPYYQREAVFGPMKDEIARLIQLKQTDFSAFDRLRRKLQAKVVKNAGEVAKYAEVLHIEAIELNLPEVFFNTDGTLKPHGGMDVIIGNPPWEVWKPNSDEFFAPFDPGYLKLSKQKKLARQKELFSMFPKLSEKWDKDQDRIELGSKYFRSEDAYRFQTWKVGGRKTSADLNLYRIAVERFTQLLSKDGRMSVLVPDNLVTDAGTTGLRHLLFENYHVREFLSFENVKGIFPAVHRSYKFAVLTVDSEQSQTDEFEAFFYQQDLDVLESKEVRMKYDLATIRKMDDERLALFEARTKEELALYLKIRLRYPALRDTGLLKFGNDFHKTNDSSLFIPYTGAKNELLLYEGKTMNQFKLLAPEQFSELSPAVPVQAVDLDVPRVKQKVKDRYKDYRIVHRSIGRATDARTMIATLLPPHTTFANSLTGQVNLEMPLADKLFSLGHLNSYVIDYALRHLVTTNINQIYIKQLPIPRVEDVADADKIIQITKALLLENKGMYEELNELVPGDEYSGREHNDLIAELNARIILNFELTREEVVQMMRSFESAKHATKVQEETQRIIDVYDRLSGGEDSEQ